MLERMFWINLKGARIALFEKQIWEPAVNGVRMKFGGQVPEAIIKTGATSTTISAIVRVKTTLTLAIGELEMITVEEHEAIRRAYYVEGKSKRQIAREQGHSRKTVEKAIENRPAQPSRLSEPISCSPKCLASSQAALHSPYDL
jgi:hypothetical protein